MQVICIYIRTWHPEFLFCKPANRIIQPNFKEYEFHTWETIPLVNLTVDFT